MIKWDKLNLPKDLIHNPNLVYIIPCDQGSEIWFNDEKCVIEDKTVLEIIDKLNATGCTSFLLSKKEIEELLSKNININLKDSI